MTLAAVAFGGALGSVLRYLIASGLQTWSGRHFPIGTLMVNVSGCLAIGLLYVWLVERSPVAAEWRAFWLVGVLGGFTTFSSFTLESWYLFSHGDALRAIGNVALSVVLCLLATWLGVIAGRSI